MAAPLIPQGTLNKVKASIVWEDFPELNVGASYLGQPGMRIAFEGNATEYQPTMTGAVTSPNPYQMVMLAIPLLKTQGLSDQYKSQWETDTRLGDGTLRPDVNDGSGLSPFSLVNCSIEGVGELSLGGTDPVFGVTIRGYIVVNNALWN